MGAATPAGTIYDVVIIGGGPAGTAAALPLARAGRRVAVVERTRYEGTRIGETLPPRATPLLAALGVPAPLSHDGHVAAHGIVTAWGTAEPRCNDFIVNPYGNGWHLDRARFDRTLAAHARAAGAMVCEATGATHCVAHGDRWRIGLRSAAGPAEIDCRFVIDATGRRASALKKRAGRRVLHDRLVGVAAFHAHAADGDCRTLIEATRDGWWYSARLPAARCVTVYMTDADTIEDPRHDFAGILQRRLCAAPATRARGANFAEACITMLPAMTGHYARVHGENWLLAGDAATTWDPLSGQGICKALESGMRAARAVDCALDGNRNGLLDYGQWTQARFAEYLRSRTRYYRAEQRWPDAAFWQRRHPPH